MVVVDVHGFLCLRIWESCPILCRQLFRMPIPSAKDTCWIRFTSSDIVMRLVMHYLTALLLHLVTNIRARACVTLRRRARCVCR